MRKNPDSVSAPPSLIDTAKIQGSYSANRNSKRIKNRSRYDETAICLPALESWEKDQVKVSLSYVVISRPNRQTQSAFKKEVETIIQ